MCWYLSVNWNANSVNTLFLSFFHILPLIPRTNSSVCNDISSNICWSDLRHQPLFMRYNYYPHIINKKVKSAEWLRKCLKSSKLRVRIEIHPRLDFGVYVQTTSYLSHWVDQLENSTIYRFNYSLGFSVICFSSCWNGKLRVAWPGTAKHNKASFLHLSLIFFSW